MQTSPRRGFWLFVAVLASFAAAKAVLFDSLDPDCFWHLRVADQLCRQGIGPVADDISFASVRTPWTPYSWLAELGMKAIWDHGGYRAAVAAQAIVQGLVVLMLGALCGTTRKYGPAAIATAAGAFLILPYLSFRPVTAGFLILLTIAWLLARGGRAIWWVVPLTVLYANVHLFVFFVPVMAVISDAFGRNRRDAEDAERRERGADFRSTGVSPVLGDPATGATPVLRSMSSPLCALRVSAVQFRRVNQGKPRQTTRKLRARLGLIAAVTLASLATPMLPGLLRSVWNYSANDQMVAGPVIAEMHGLVHGPGSIANVAVVVAMLVCVGTGRVKLPTGQLLLIGLTAVLTFKIGRFAPLFVVVTAPAVAATLRGVSDRVLARSSVAAAFAILLLLIAGRTFADFPDRGRTLESWVNRHGPETPGYPCAAADFVATSVEPATGLIVNEFSWGGYLGWRLGDRYQVLLDGRTQVFSTEFWRSTYLGSDADRTRYLSTVTADAAVLPVRHSEFRASLISLGWTSAYRDDRAEVLVPPKSPPKPVTGIRFAGRPVTGVTYASWR